MLLEAVRVPMRTTRGTSQVHLRLVRSDGGRDSPPRNAVAGTLSEEEAVKLEWSLMETEDGCLVFQQSELGIVAAVHVNGCVDLCGAGASDEIHVCNLDDLVFTLGFLKSAAKAAFLTQGEKSWPK
jgi:hypothetical protein